MFSFLHLELIALALATILLTACGGGGGGTTPSSTTDTETVSNPQSHVNQQGPGSTDSTNSEKNQNTDQGANAPANTPGEPANSDTPPPSSPDNNSDTTLTVELGDNFSIYNDEVLNLTSTISNGQNVTYKWQQIAGSPVTFQHDDEANTAVTYSSTEPQTLAFSLTASNRDSTATDTITVTIKDRIDEAVKYGNPELLPARASELEQRIQVLLQQLNTSLQALHEQIYASNPVIYDPSRNSRFFVIKSLSDASEIIKGNQGKVFAAAQEKSGQRSIAFGSNVFVEMNSGLHADYISNMRQILNWLISPQTININNNDKFTVALILMSASNMNSTENWLKSQYPTATVNRCSIETELTACVSNANLIITGSSTLASQTNVTALFNNAASTKTAILYAHNGSWNSTSLTNPILEYFGVQTQAPGESGNYYSQDSANWTSAAQMRASNSTLEQISSLVTRFQTNGFSFSITNCAIDDESCSNLPAYSSEFLNITNSLRTQVALFDGSAQDIFMQQNSYKLEKLLILLADKYRQSVRFPMSKTSSDTNVFLKSLYADSMVYVSRQHNPVQTDLGNFSRTNFSHITPSSKTINVTSREPFRAAGVYALPGQTVIVRRTDNNTAVKARVFINTQRATSTQHMSSGNGYNRPKYLQSNHVPISAGQSITLTSPYGGPVEIEFFDQGSSLAFEFSNIGMHPYWSQGTDESTFLNALAANDYDWVEIATEHFELHSTIQKMRTTLSNDRWNTPEKLEFFISKYHHNYHKVLAGFKGEDIDTVSEIVSFAENNGLSIPEFKTVQHGNYDQQSCGSGCSGNPYDAAWEFEALGHGDLHEVGHNVESSRFKFNGIEDHATTNFYSYYAKSRAFQEDAVPHNCQTLPFNTMLDDLRASLTKPDPKAYMAGLAYSSWNKGAALIVEMAMHAQNRGSLANGWHLIPRMHILQKAYEQSYNNDSNWNATKSQLGFSTYSRSEARSIDNNDWLLIAASYSASLDYRPFLDMFGLSYSSKANAQVASFGFPAVSRAFFKPASNDAYCNTLAQPQVNL